MNKNIKNIIKEKIVCINLNKSNLLKQIKKSVTQNNNIENKIKIYNNYLFSKNTKKGMFLTKKHRVCLLTGKRAGVLHNFNFSRYTIKKLILANKYTNLKKHNW